jgi:hypothetical protein
MLGSNKDPRGNSNERALPSVDIEKATNKFVGGTLIIHLFGPRQTKTA